MTDEQYRCRSDGAVVVGSEGLRAHRAEHRKRGEDIPEWDVVEQVR